MPEPCPVEGCPKNCRDIEGLYGHLYTQHNKSELIKTIVQLRGIQRKGEDLDKTTEA